MHCTAVSRNTLLTTPQYTFGLLVLASLLTTAKQYFGDPIDCIGGKDVEKVVLCPVWPFGATCCPVSWSEV